MLHGFGSVCGPHARDTKAGGDDTVGHLVKLGDGGPNGGCQVFISLFISLCPDGAQAVTGHYLLEQLLWTNVTWA